MLSVRDAVARVVGNVVSLFNRNLQISDRVWIYGGYDYEPMWLQDNDGYCGEVVGFIPGQNTEPAALVLLDEEIHLPNATGNYVVLELRHVGAKWLNNGIVHIELCDFKPPSTRWQDRQQGAWVEGAASYKTEKGA